MSQHRLAVDIRQAEIENDEIGRIFRDRTQRRRAVIRQQDLIARRLQRMAQEALDLRFVIDHKDQGMRFHGEVFIAA